MQTVGVSTRRLRGCTGARHCFMFLSKCNIHVRFKKKKKVYVHFCLQNNRMSSRETNQKLFVLLKLYSRNTY